MADGKNLDKFALNIATNPPDMKAGISNIQNRADFGSRQTDTTMVNSDGNNASIRITDNNINQSASQDSQIKLSDQKNTFQSFEEQHTTNRFKLDTYEIIVNGHKLNSNLWEYSDMKAFKDMYGGTHAIGNFTVLGTILTPSWDDMLHKYVLMRRLCRMPLFSPKTNVPEILKTLNIDDPTKVAYQYGVKQSTETAAEYYKRVGHKFDKTKYASDTSSSGGGKANSAMVEKACQIAEEIAGKNLAYVFGASGPDSYDCTGFVSTAFNQAGFDIPVCHGDAFDAAFPSAGFDKIPYSDGNMEQLQRGDVLNNSEHTELYIGDGKFAGAHSTNSGVNVCNYFDDAWEYIYRYPKSDSDSDKSDKNDENNNGNKDKKDDKS